MGILQKKNKHRIMNEKLTDNRLDYYKHTQAYAPPAELHSPQPGQQEFAAELADNAQKPPRSP